MSTERKKYILTNNVITVRGHTLHQIQAARDLVNIKSGTLGGWIEKEENLSHEGLCWVNGEACVYENAKVSENAQISKDAWVAGNAIVMGNAQISGSSFVYGNAFIRGDAEISGDTRVYGDARICDLAQVYGGAWIYENARVCGNAQVFGNAQIRSNAVIYSGDITSVESYICIGPIGSRNDMTTFFLTDDKIMVACGCFKGEISKFEDAVHWTHAGTKHERDYIDAINLAKHHFNKTEKEIGIAGDRKYILTNETKEINGHLLHRIQAIKDFGSIKAGTLGGWIEKEPNLSHEGDCWVDANALVYEDALICDQAMVFGNSVVCNQAIVFGNAKIYGNSHISGNMKINIEMTTF